MRNIKLATEHTEWIRLTGSLYSSVCSVAKLLRPLVKIEKKKLGVVLQSF